jgi:hypothetical protein
MGQIPRDLPGNLGLQELGPLESRVHEARMGDLAESLDDG